MSMNKCPAPKDHRGKLPDSQMKEMAETKSSVIDPKGRANEGRMRQGVLHEHTAKRSRHCV